MVLRIHQLPMNIIFIGMLKKATIAKITNYG